MTPTKPNTTNSELDLTRVELQRIFDQMNDGHLIDMPLSPGEAITRIEALIASKVEEARQEAIDALPDHKPFKCEFGHKQVNKCKQGHVVYSHKSRWCCACDADISFAAKWVKDEPEALQPREQDKV